MKLYADIKIDLKYNYGFSWVVSENRHLFVKGFIFNENEDLLQGEALVKYCSDIQDARGLRDKVLSKIGNFAIIVKTEEGMLMAVDSVRTFPLFYLKKKGIFLVSDSSDYLKTKYGLALNVAVENEFMVAGYVTCEDTLVEGVLQLQAGEIVVYSVADQNFKKEIYTDYLPREIMVYSNQNQYSDKLLEILNKSLLRMIKFAQDRPLLVPLSGGYDSRLIVCMLKKHGVKSVICFTYGAKDSKEVDTSRKVAQALGYKWHFIEYEKGTIPSDYIKAKDFESYYKYAANGVSVFLLQDFFAVKQLKEKRLVPENCVVVPGHSADFLAGSHLTYENVNNRNRKKTIQNIFKKHFVLNDTVHINISILDYVKEVNCFFEYAVDDNWNLKERQAKFIVNSVRIYEFFGFQHYLLFWDKELINFFKELPAALKMDTKLYIETIFTYYFDPFEVGFYKEKESIFRRSVKKVLEVAPTRIVNRIKKKKHVDFNRTRLMENVLLDDMCRENVGYTNINGIIAHWYIKKCGDD